MTTKTRTLQIQFKAGETTCEKCVLFVEEFDLCAAFGKSPKLQINVGTTAVETDDDMVDSKFIRIPECLAAEKAASDRANAIRDREAKELEALTELDEVRAERDELQRKLDDAEKAVAQTVPMSVFEEADYHAQGKIASLESERDGWMRAAESQNKQWSQKCEETTEVKAARDGLAEKLRIAVEALRKAETNLESDSSEICHAKVELLIGVTLARIEKTDESKT